MTDEQRQRQRLWQVAQEVALHTTWTVDSVYSLLLNYPRLDSLHTIAAINAAEEHAAVEGDDLSKFYAYQLAAFAERSIVR